MHEKRGGGQKSIKTCLRAFEKGSEGKKMPADTRLGTAEIDSTLKKVTNN